MKICPKPTELTSCFEVIPQGVPATNVLLSSLVYHQKTATSPAAQPAGSVKLPLVGLLPVVLAVPMKLMRAAETTFDNTIVIIRATVIVIKNLFIVFLRQPKCYVVIII